MNSLVILGATVAGFVGLRYFQRRDWVTPAQAQGLVAQGALLLDVRSTQEFGSNHLPGALNIPLTDLPGRLAELGDKEKDVVVYCLSGGRSSSAKQFLVGNGFSSVHNLGAMRRWA
jgi:phage shock protein E